MNILLTSKPFHPTCQRSSDEAYVIYFSSCIFYTSIGYNFFSQQTINFFDRFIEIPRIHEQLCEETRSKKSAHICLSQHPYESTTQRPTIIKTLYLSESWTCINQEYLQNMHSGLLPLRSCAELLSTAEKN